jgi:hypothetical protein
MGWKSVEYEAIPNTDKRIVSVLNSFKKLYVNGGPLLRIFKPSNHLIFDDAAFSDIRGSNHFLQCFLETQTVRENVADLAIPFPLDAVPKHRQLCVAEFQTTLLQTLMAGGAYERPSFSVEIALQMVQEFIDALADSESQYLTIWQIEGAWTDWFYDVAWDYSFVLLQLKARKCVLFCITDTD